MIVSIHLPKTGGMSLRELLKRQFGERVYFDYGDWIGEPGPEAEERREKRLRELEAGLDDLERDHDCIHGHFYVDKWKSLLDSPRFFSIFRDPLESIPSLYEYILRHPEIKHPSLEVMRKQKWSLRQFIEEMPGRDNFVSRILGSVRVSDLELVGIQDCYETSVSLFCRHFLKKDSIENLPTRNVNPDRKTYPLTREEATAIARFHDEDLEIYQQARTRFFEQLRAQKTKRFSLFGGRGKNA